MSVLKNARHEKFAQELAKGRTADEAYQEAGFKPNRGNAARMRGDEQISARVDELIGKAAEKAEATVERVIKELSRVSFSDLRRAFDADGRLLRPGQWSDDTAAAISSIEVVTRSIGEGEVEYVHKIKAWDKNSALEKLARHLGMFVERHEHTGKDGGPIQVSETPNISSGMAKALEALKGLGK